jgi:hypothetical protein
MFNVQETTPREVNHSTHSDKYQEELSSLMKQLTQQEKDLYDFYIQLLGFIKACREEDAARLLVIDPQPFI